MFTSVTRLPDWYYIIYTLGGIKCQSAHTFLSKKPQNFHPQPQKCCPHPHLSFWGFLRVNLKWKFSRILNKPRIFKLFLCYLIAFLVNFLRFLRIPQKTSKMLTSSSPQIVRIFEGRSSKTSNFLGHPQPQKNLEILKILTSTSKNLKFQGETEDPRFLRSHFTTLTRIIDFLLMASLWACTV